MLDKETGLRWERTPSSEANSSNAWGLNLVGSSFEDGASSMSVPHGMLRVPDAPLRLVYRTLLAAPQDCLPAPA
jgi:hypothetical protein